MVIAAHEDDEALAFAGVIHAAVLEGDRVIVVMVTNGDAAASQSTGLLRESETVAAVGVLGVPEDQVIFLGYPNGSAAGSGVAALYGASDANAVYTSPIGTSATYGNRGLGSAEWHRYKYGYHASYTRANIVSDLTEVISTYQPDVIFTHERDEQQVDHASIGKFVEDMLNAGFSGFSPYLYVSLVHDRGSGWPDKSEPAFQPTISWPAPDILNWAVSWNNRIEIAVPDDMLSTDQAVNLKAVAIRKYSSQSASNLDSWLYSFCHPTEVFWIRKVGAYRTHVSHGSVNGSVR
jgi:LmbE family N-acetylglucosaminyl deacetylase